MKVTAAVSDTLPMSVLLGTDVPELGRLLGVNPSSTHSEEALVVMTRAQTRRKEEEDAEREEAEKMSSATPNPVQEQVERDEVSLDTVKGSEEVIGGSFSDDIFFPTSAVKLMKSRREKRETRRQHGLVRAKDPPQKKKHSEEETRSAKIDCRNCRNPIPHWTWCERKQLKQKSRQLKATSNVGASISDVGDQRDIQTSLELIKSFFQWSTEKKF